MRTFRGDLKKFRTKLKKREPFALSRYGDGELGILKDELIDDFEYKHDPADPRYVFLREQLLDSFRYKHKDYYVGISCPECVGGQDFEWMKRHSQQGDRQLTFACVFVNSNYSYFLERLLPLFNDYEVILVCNKEASLAKLPFRVKKHFPIGMNAWKDDFVLVDRIEKYIIESAVKGSLFLFCAGPFGCILSHRLHSFCQENTYLDIGSTIDHLLFSAPTRGYLNGSPDLKDSCVWE